MDTHAHVIGLPPQFPFVENRSYTPPEAAIPDYIGMLDATGMSYGVLIQVSVHGTDNRLLVEALRQYPKRLRGIAVIPHDLKDVKLAELKEAGVVGLRLNVLYGGGVGFDNIARYGDLCRELGWHIQLLVDARALPDVRQQIAALPIPVVVDHMGHMPVAEGVASPGFQALLSIVRDGGWVKLSGAFRISGTGFPYRDTLDFARALVEAAPDRCVWGSDWPHVANWDYMMNVGDLLDLLADWIPDEGTRLKVLVENPHRLYGVDFR